MGVKSTVQLTRAKAVQRMVDLKLEVWRKDVLARVESMTDTQIEDDLECLNDLAKGGEGFENYMIVSED